MEEIFPHTLQEFENFIRTEADCIKYLEQLLRPDSFIRSHCNSTDYWRTKRGLQYVATRLSLFTTIFR